MTSTMFLKYVSCQPVNRHIGQKYLSTIVQTKNAISCGLHLIQKNISDTIYGPIGQEVVKEVDLTGKTCLVTGANSGIGLEMSRCLASRGGAVLMACRNKYAASVAVNPVERNNSFRFYEVNLASLKSVRKCCEEILKHEKQIDIVMLNAGVFGLPWTLTEDHLETTFQVNYLSQFHLLMNIESILTPEARVVFTASESHRHVNWSFRDQIHPTEKLVSLPKEEYTSIKAYNVSKLCCLLATHYLRYRWMKTNKQVFAAHPGSFVKTRLSRNWWPYDALYTLMLPFSKNISQAASTPLYCATSPDLGGVSATYFKDCKSCEESELANDFHLSFRIYDLTRELILERQGMLTIPDLTAAADKLSQPAAKVTEHDTLTPNYST